MSLVVGIGLSLILYLLRFVACVLWCLRFGAFVGHSLSSLFQFLFVIEGDYNIIQLYTTITVEVAVSMCRQH